jgi:hypothetical protein
LNLERRYPRQDSNLCTRFRKPLLYPPELRGPEAILPCHPKLRMVRRTGTYTRSVLKRDSQPLPVASSHSPSSAIVYAFMVVLMLARQASCCARADWPPDTSNYVCEVPSRGTEQQVTYAGASCVSGVRPSGGRSICQSTESGRACKFASYPCSIHQ